MFRRLAELSAGGPDATQATYNAGQSYRYNTLLPNIIPSNGTYPAPTGVRQALQGVDVYAGGGAGAVVNVVPDVDRLFVPGNTGAGDQAAACASASIDSLLSSQDPNKPLRCAWVYTPPVAGSPNPQLSRGVLGTVQGPVDTGATLPSYQQYYWDLAQAKRQMLLDKCKSLRNCTNVTDPLYATDCGYCTDINQGVPIDTNGNPLYPNAQLGNCSPGSLITSSNVANCPSRVAPAGNGPAPQVDTTCVANSSGQLSVPCFERLILQGGCSDQGALAQALSSGATPQDYLAGARQLPSFQLYQTQASPKLNETVFAQGQATVPVALQEVQNLAAATQQPPTSAIGAAARDLCLQKGAIAAYNFCQDIPTSTPPPFDSYLQCLQTAFLQAGGTPTGRRYPSASNLSFYNTNFPTLGNVYSYFTTLAGTARGSQTGPEGFAVQRRTNRGVGRGAGAEGFQDIDETVRTTYLQQAAALLDLQGIMPDQLGNRPYPPVPGVESFWIVQGGAGGWRVVNYTIEPTFPSSSTGQALSQLPGGGVLWTLTDLRAKADQQVNMILTNPSNTVLALNQKIRLDQQGTDIDGFLNPDVGEIAWKSQCWSLKGSAPNLLKTYSAAVPGVSLAMQPCNGAQQMLPLPSIARERNGPIFQFELNPLTTRSTLDELRFYEWFQPANTGLVAYGQSDSLLKAPGNNGFTRFSQGSANYHLSNISTSAWRTFTFVFRYNTMPVREWLLEMGTGTDSSSPTYIQVFLTPINGSTAAVNYNSNVGIPYGNAWNSNIRTNVALTLGQWYMCIVSQNGPAASASAWNIAFVSLDTAVQTGWDLSVAQPQANAFSVSVPSGAPINSMGGSDGYVHLGGWSFGTPSFNWDLAWLHFFNQVPDVTTIQRDAVNNWIVMQA